MKVKDFNYGNYSYRYELMPQARKTLSLTVRPDMGIVVRCPEYAPDERINEFLKRKWIWLTKQLKFFARFQRTIYEREHISGESFIYLGRQYKLVVKKGKENRVSLTKGKLVVITKRPVSDGQYNKSLIDQWYQERAKVVFNELYKEGRNAFLS